MKPCDEGFSHAFARGVSCRAGHSCLLGRPPNRYTIGLSSRTLQVEDALRQGQRLESQRRWGEALTHYEDALRLYPAE